MIALSKLEKKQLRAQGYFFAYGVIELLAVAMCFVLVVQGVINFTWNILDLGTDNSDKNGIHRSGFTVLTDYGTRVQYLMTPTGHVVPRLKKDGNTILIAEDE